MAIRRPPTTFSDTISTTDIADDAISGDKLANDIAISTTGALTVAGNTTLSGTNNLGSNPTVTLGSNATFPAGVVIQAVYWRIPATAVSTSGSWSASSNPTGPMTYGVANTSITRKSTNSKMIGVATGHVDNNASTSHPSVVSLTAGSSNNTAGNTIFGAGYRHVRNSQTEPFVYSFAFQDDFSAQPNSAVPVYYLRCHSSASDMYFSRVYAGNYTSNPFTLLFWEVEI